jgi:sugar lactone lactonase YvrE
MHILVRNPCAFLLFVGVFAIGTINTQAADVLVADRLSNSVYRYSESGVLLGTVVTDSVNINQAVGLALSPDFSQLYVSSFQNARVVKYDYNVDTGQASNPMIFAEGAADNLVSPNAILFSEDGDTIYVSNLGGSGVARFNLDGTSAGAPLMFPTPTPPDFQPYFQFSGLEFAPTGELLVAAFQDFPAGANGKVGRSNAGGTALEDFVDAAPLLNGASGLLVHEEHLYVTGMFASNIQRFDLADGERDSSFLVADLAFPSDLAEAPDGNGFLVGILGVVDGQGQIARYDFDGNLLGTFANHGGGGFTEATAFIVVPDRATVGDYNDDGVVDAADYVVWRNAAPTATLPNDDSPGSVDASDYADWRAHFAENTSATLSGFEANAVPEPGILQVLLIVAAAGGVMSGRIRRNCRQSATQFAPDRWSPGDLTMA